MHAKGEFLRRRSLRLSADALRIRVPKSNVQLLSNSLAKRAQRCAKRMPLTFRTTPKGAKRYQNETKRVPTRAKGPLKGHRAEQFLKRPRKGSGGNDTWIHIFVKNPPTLGRAC